MGAGIGYRPVDGQCVGRREKDHERGGFGGGVAGSAAGNGDGIGGRYYPGNRWRSEGRCNAEERRILPDGVRRIVRCRGNRPERPGGFERGKRGAGQDRQSGQSDGRGNGIYRDRGDLERRAGRGIQVGERRNRDRGRRREGPGRGAGDGNYSGEARRNTGNRRVPGGGRGAEESRSGAGAGKLSVGEANDQHREPGGRRGRPGIQRNVDAKQGADRGERMANESGKHDEPREPGRSREGKNRRNE